MMVVLTYLVNTNNDDSVWDVCLHAIHGDTLTHTTCFSILVMLVILVNCVFMATKEEIPNTEYVCSNCFFSLSSLMIFNDLIYH